MKYILRGDLDEEGKWTVILLDETLKIRVLASNIKYGLAKAILRRKE